MNQPTTRHERGRQLRRQRLQVAVAPIWKARR